MLLGHLKIINFTFGTNGKLKVSGVPILKHISVFALPGMSVWMVSHLIFKCILAKTLLFLLKKFGHVIKCMQNKP